MRLTTKVAAAGLMAAVSIALTGSGAAASQPQSPVLRGESFSEAVGARGDNIWDCNVRTVARGCTQFIAAGEIARTCDERADRRAVHGQVYWDGKVRAKLHDSNGSAPGCDTDNLSIAEGTRVSVRTYVEGFGWTGWEHGVA